jgi:hypothetical protein
MRLLSLPLRVEQASAIPNNNKNVSISLDFFVFFEGFQEFFFVLCYNETT